MLRIITLQKSLFSHTFSCHLSLFFVLKEWSNLDNKNHRNVWTLFLLIMLMVFLLQDNAIVFLYLKSLKNELVFNDLNYVLKHKQDIFSFLAYKTLWVIVTLFFSIFSNHLFLIENLFLPSSFILKGLIFVSLCRSFFISS